MDYRGVKINMEESVHFTEDEFTVNGGSVMVYKAASVYGASYALTPTEALAGAYLQIDRNVGVDI